MWFLTGLFSGLSVFYAISFVSQKISKVRFEQFRFILVLFFLIAGFLGPEINARFTLFYRAFVISALIYAGKLYQLNEIKIKLSISLALVCFAGLCVAAYFKYYINIGGMIFGNELIFILICLAVCYLTLTIADYINRKQNRLSRLLDFIGNNTFSIMALQYLSFKLISIIQIVIYDYPIKYLAYYPVIPFKTAYWWIPYTIVGIGVPVLCSVFYDKIIGYLKEKVLNRKSVVKL